MVRFLWRCRDASAPAGLVLARAHLSEGDIHEAERCFSSVRSTADGGPREWIRLSEMRGSADVLVQQGKLLEAAVLYRRDDGKLGLIDQS